MSRPVICCLITLGALGWCNPGLASGMEPAELLLRVFSDFNQKIRADENLYRDNSDALIALADAELSPHIDFARMTRIAMAKYWSQASEEQRHLVTTEFRTYLVRSYTKILFEYRNSDLEVLSERETSETSRLLQVQVVNQQGGTAKLVGRFEKTGEQWQLIDISVEGVSLLVTARTQFSDEIARLGIDGLIARLREENRSIE